MQPFNHLFSNGSRMIKKYLSVSIGLVTVCLLLCTSKSPTEPSPSKTTVDQLEISDSTIAGWSHSSANGDTFCTYPIDSFYCCAPGNVDGGAVPYDSAGCAVIAYQTLTGPNQEISSSYAMDFLTVAKASAMFGKSKSSEASERAISGFDVSTAFADTVINGIKAFAHFNKFYVEITLLGFTDNATALACASEFLSVLKGKIQ
jgi:hypothetical protein